MHTYIQAYIHTYTDGGALGTNWREFWRQKTTSCLRYLYTHTHLFINHHTHHTPMCRCIYTHAYIHTYIHTYINTQMEGLWGRIGANFGDKRRRVAFVIYKHTHTHTRTHLFINKHTHHTPMCRCIYTHACIHTYIHTYILTYIHAQMEGLWGRIATNFGDKRRQVAFVINQLDAVLNTYTSRGVHVYMCICTYACDQLT